MGAIPQPRKIKRIGLVIEMEDGGKVMVYADDAKAAEVTITRETAPIRRWQDGRPANSRAGVVTTSILIEGLETVQMTETPKTAPYLLESIRGDVQSGQRP